MTAIFSLIETNGMWEAVSKISNPFSLVAFALAAIVLVMLAWIRSRRGSIPNAFWIVISILVLVGLGTAFIQKPGPNEKPGPSEEVYRVRVTVVDPQGLPIEDAKVWSSVGGEAKKVDGGWQFDIPASSKPLDGKISIIATKQNSFLTGKSDLILGGDYYPIVTIHLKRDDSAKVRGQIVDEKNRAVKGALVFVVGYESEAVTTREGGNFELPAHAPVNEEVSLHAEKSGYAAVTSLHPAGDAPAILVLKKNR